MLGWIQSKPGRGSEEKIPPFQESNPGSPRHTESAEKGLKLGNGREWF
jgi:hypothetical protein